MRALMVGMLVACAASAAYGSGEGRRFPLPPVGAEITTTDRTFGCRVKAQALLIRAMKQEDDWGAEWNAKKRAEHLGECEWIPKNATLIFRQMDPNGFTYEVRRRGFPDSYWIP